MTVVTKKTGKLKYGKHFSRAKNMNKTMHGRAEHMNKTIHEQARFSGFASSDWLGKLRRNLDTRCVEENKWIGMVDIEDSTETTEEKIRNL